MFNPNTTFDELRPGDVFFCDCNGLWSKLNDNEAECMESDSAYCKGDHQGFLPRCLVEHYPDSLQAS